ncbi:MAG: hypothetical protein Q7O12_03170 [Deltaproteobacteria bacterium]|nr:hypothetical protein [Deltaproteobacteria bacterium]
MSLDGNAPTGPTVIVLEKQWDILMGRRGVFQNEKGVLPEKAGKAGNSGVAACFIMKLVGLFITDLRKRAKLLNVS